MVLVAARAPGLALAALGLLATRVWPKKSRNSGAPATPGLSRHHNWLPAAVSLPADPTAPVLLVHGLEGTVVPPSQAKVWQRRLIVGASGTFSLSGGRLRLSCRSMLQRWG